MYEFLHRAKFCSLEAKNGQLDRFMTKKKDLEKICAFQLTLCQLPTLFVPKGFFGIFEREAEYDAGTFSSCSFIFRQVFDM